MESFSLITLLGGMALFLYGMFMCRDGIQHFAGERFKSMLNSVASNRFSGLMLGATATMALQSSTALTVMLVGLAHAGLITIAQSMPVLLGADIGTTVTVQLISFRLERYSLLVVAFGFIALFFGKKQRTKFIGTILFGLGLIFFGMKLMIEAVEPLKNAETFSRAMTYLGDSPFQSLLIAMAFTGLVHSSAATIGLIISLGMAGTMDLETAIPMVLGANIGTCFTALLAGIGSSANGKRIAVAHVILKVVGVALVYPFITPFARLVLLTSSEVPRQIANAHTIFNVTFALVFLPFTGVAAHLIQKLFTGAEAMEKPFGPIYLDPQAVQTPALALGYVKRETVRMAGMVREMLTLTRELFRERNRDKIDRVQDLGEKVDMLENSIRLYLATVNKTSYSHEQSGRELEMVSTTNDIDGVSEMIVHGVLEDARKYILSGINFSPTGEKELDDFETRVISFYDMCLTAYDSVDETLARQVIRERDRISEAEALLIKAHLERLHSGTKESLQTSSIHINCISNLGRIASISSRLASAILNRASDKRIEDALA